MQAGDTPADRAVPVVRYPTLGHALLQHAPRAGRLTNGRSVRIALDHHPDRCQRRLEINRPIT
jgi:hypothetical protein